MNRWLSAFKNLRFRQKLVLTYLIVIMIPLLTLGLYSFHQSRLFLQMQAEQSLRETVGTMAERLNAKLEWYDGIVKSIVSHSGMHKIFSNQYADLSVMSEDIRNVLEPYFNTVMYLNQEIEQMTVYSQGLPEVGDYMRDIGRVRQEDWLDGAIQAKKTAWYFTSQTFVAARAFPNIYVNKNTAVLYIRLNRDKVLDEIGRSNLDQYGVVISDDRQRIVFANRNAAERTKPLAPEDVVKLGDGIATLEGVPYIVIRKPIALPGWTLHCYIPVRLISADAGSIVRATFIIILVCLLTLLALVWIFSHTLIKPIRHLNKKMMQVEDGNLQVAVHSTAKDEIGQLTNRFGRMLGRINELIKEMYQNQIVQKEAEMKALQSQINPHFLYNTLSIINWKALRRNAHDISHVVTSLSKFYRTALNKGKNIISIRDELGNIQSYLDIQLIMHDGSFDVAYELDERLYEYDTINLVLQPIVENAIEHGIDRKEEGRGQLRIACFAQDEQHVFVVEDNGPGMDADTAQSVLSAQTTGYGLKNVHERIRLFFGERYGVRIESRPGAGTKVIVVLPVYRHNESAERPPSDRR